MFAVREAGSLRHWQVSCRDDASMPNHLWSIVLAAGAGRRLSSITGGIPKQFWRYDGGSTLLESTLDRVAGVSPADRTLIVVDHSHDQYLGTMTGVARRGKVLYQPADRGTAAGVLLALVHVLESTPDGVVLLTPSDHGVSRPAEFHAAVRSAVADVTSRPAGRDEVMLFGVEPDTPVGDYGWITAERRLGGERFPSVKAFVEKPTHDGAVQLFNGGSVWNTMVLVARAATLFKLCQTHVPDMTAVLALTIGLPPAHRQDALTAIYGSLRSADFSRDVLGEAHGLGLCTFPRTMGWSDLGTPDRLAAWLSAQLGADQAVRTLVPRAAFPGVRAVA